MKVRNGHCRNDERGGGAEILFFKHLLSGDFLESGVVGKLLRRGTLGYVAILGGASFSLRKTFLKVRNGHCRNDERGGGAEILFFKHLLWGDFLESGVVGKVLRRGTLGYIGILVKASFSCRKFGFKVRNRHCRNNEPGGGAEILVFQILIMWGQVWR